MQWLVSRLSIFRGVTDQACTEPYHEGAWKMTKKSELNGQITVTVTSPSNVEHAIAGQDAKLVASGCRRRRKKKGMGYWPSVRSRWLAKFFFVSVHKHAKRLISSHLDRTNLVNKGFIIWLSVKVCLRNTAGSPERARWLHLARSGSQSQRAIWFILPARGASWWPL